MTKNLLYYNYQTTVREIYDLTKEEASKILEEEKTSQEDKYYVIIFESVQNI